MKFYDNKGNVHDTVFALVASKVKSVFHRKKYAETSRERYDDVAFSGFMNPPVQDTAEDSSNDDMQLM